MPTKIIVCLLLMAMASPDRAGVAGEAPGTKAAPPKSELPAPVSQDYRIVPGDALEISVWREESLTTKVLVRPDGGISFPLIGNLIAEGQTVDQVKSQIKKRLTDFLSDPEVNVAVVATNQKVYVLGKVLKPGEIPMPAKLTVMQALSMAGGLAPFADEDDIKIIRRNGENTVTFPFDYDSVTSGEGLEQNIPLLNGDVVVVP